MEVNRRGFLQLTAASTMGIAAGYGGKQVGALMELASEEERVPNGPEKWVTTACNLCAGGCGVKVRLVDKRAVKLEGNPFHPLTRGGLCPVAQASLQLLYNPDRVKGPLKRVGVRGGGHWESLSWEEALKELAVQLRGLRDRLEPHALVVVSGRSWGLMPELFRRFSRAFGTPNFVEAREPEASQLALWLTQGIREPMAYDLENTQYILSFGVPFVDGWWNPVRQMRALVQLRQGTPGRRGKLVQVESRLSPTAAKADEWVPVNPGTEGVLALGLAHVLVVDGLFDHRFVAEKTFGFEDWRDPSGVRHAGFRTLLVQEYTPSAVERVTGAPEQDIRRLAKEFARFGPAVALGPSGGQAQCLQTALAVQALNALVGSIDRPGGTLVARRASAEGLFRSGRGMIFPVHEEAAPSRLLREWEWAPPPYKSFQEFWEELVKQGGWIDPSYRYGEWPRVFQTPSGKYEFYSQTFRGVLEARAGTGAVEEALYALGLKLTDDRAFLPHDERHQAQDAERSFPLCLTPFQLLTLGDGSRANQPFLQEVAAPHANIQWGSWVEMNPEMAKSLGIRDNDWVWVESSAGKVKVRARLYPGIMPGVVAMPLGQGHTELGRYARGRGVNPMILIGRRCDPLTGLVALTTRVKVYKAADSS